MADTCSFFYKRILNFGGEIWLYYPIDKPEVPILYKLKLDKRSLTLKRLFNLIQIPNRKEVLVWERV
jgi:hypothetical protein